MSKEHLATIEWLRGDQSFADGRYSRRHQWRFDGGAVVAASSSPHVVRTPFSDPSCVDPEEAFVASIASCHMLWFLSIALDAGHVVDSYIDHASGVMQPRADGKLWMARVTLHPRVAFHGLPPSEEQLRQLHERAHSECFIANSVKTEIVVA